jgi:hypothetical protein
MTDTLTAVGQDVVTLSDYAYERLRTRIKGLTDDEYFWEPVAGCWSVRSGADGVFRSDGAGTHPEPAPLTTIAWRLAHIIGLVGADRNATWLGLKPASPWAGDGEPATAQAATERLDQAYGRFRSAITEVEPAALLEPLGPIGGAYARDTRLAFVLHELDELIHHGAEVGTMRDLYRALHPA